MIVWRIANAKYAALDGLGGITVPGWWHNAGHPIVYTADSAAMAMLEVRVHLDLTAIHLTRFVLLKIEFPDNVPVQVSDANPHDEIPARNTGDVWLAERKTAVLRVSSALAPEGFNYLINPLHTDAAKTAVLNQAPFAFDARLFR